jgi:hypothetical protein
MSSWVLSCPNCKNSFEHSKINDYTLVEFLEPLKPSIPLEGAFMQCPNCGHPSVYQRCDLMYYTCRENPGNTKRKESSTR